MKRVVLSILFLLGIFSILVGLLFLLAGEADAQTRNQLRQEGRVQIDKLEKLPNGKFQMLQKRGELSESGVNARMDYLEARIEELKTLNVSNMQIVIVEGEVLPLARHNPNMSTEMIIEALLAKTIEELNVIREAQGLEPYEAKPEDKGGGFLSSILP